MRAGTELDILVAVLHPVHDRHISGNAEIAGDVEHPQLAPGISKLGLQIADIGIVELLEVDPGTLQPVVPPDGVGIAFDEFEEALNDGFLAGVAGRATVGVRMEAAIKEVEQTGWKVFEALVAQRPDRRPLGPPRRIERLRNRMRIVRLLGIPVLKLRFAEKLNVIGVKGVAGSEIGKAARRPDLVTLENARIALDRLHQRAGLALLGRGALAEAAAAQSGPELVDALRRRREIVVGEKIGVHRQIDLDPLEPRNHAGQRAYMLAEARYRGSRRHGAVSAAGHDELAAFGDLDRRRRTARVLQFLAAAGLTLRT